MNDHNYSQFYAMIDRCPRIAALWDKNTHSLNVEMFENELGVLSSGERAMAQFFASVWFYDAERYGFDLADVASSLDLEERKTIIEWLLNPFYP